MSENLVTNIGHCLTIASDLVGGNMSLVYYSHIPTLVITLFMGIFVLKAGKNSLPSKIFFSFCIMFSIWVIANLISWIGTSSVWIMFFWSLLGLSDIIFYVLGLYFFYVFINGKDIDLWLKLVFAGILAPFLIIAPTALNMPGFDYVNCMALDTSFLGYLFYAKIIIAVWMATLAVYKYRRAINEDKPRIVILSLGLGLFFSTFFVTGYLADTYIRYDIELYGLYAMTVFMGILAYLIVRFKAFDIKLLATKALVYGLIILIGSQFFFIKTATNMILTGITLSLAIIFGGFLSRSVSKEVEQREHIEKLAGDLALTNNQLQFANEKLKELDKQKTEFVSMASHQLRSPLTAIKGYSSMLLEGSFGEFPEKAHEAVDRIFQSSQKLVNVIEDFLNVTRIELGKMKYEIVNFDISKTAEQVIGEIKPNIIKKGLKISYEADNEDHTINADPGKISQVISNVIDNASKYTKEGWIKVRVENTKKTEKSKTSLVRVIIKDSGIGIKKEVIPKLFEKFIRADDAGKTNILGTGLGLYVAKQMVEGLGGKIWGESEGEGKGSTFIIEFKQTKTK